MVIKTKRKILLALFAFLFVAACAGSALTFARAETVEVRSQDLWKSVKFSSVGRGDVPEWYANLPSGAENNLLALSGVEVVNYGANATIAYKNTVDVSSLTKDDVFLQLAVAPEQRGTADFKEITVRMTDAEDPSNYVTIDIRLSQWWKATTFYQVGTGEMAGLGLRWGYYKDGESEAEGGLVGTERLMGAFTGYHSMLDRDHYDLSKGATRPITLSYDYEEKAFYCYTPDSENRKIYRDTILDLDDPRHVGYGNEWKGFSSGRVNVQIEANDFAASQASYIITQFNGVNYGDEIVRDTQKPSMTTQADEDPSVLTAVAGKMYPLFSAVADDCIDGAIKDVKKYVIAPDSQEETLLTGDSFVPPTAGKYTLIYSATDRAGNENRKEYTLFVVTVAEAMALETEGNLPETVKVGESVSIPALSVAGGVGQKTTQVVVYRLEGDDERAENVSSYTPYLAGTYVVEYTATDYLGIQAKRTYYFEAARSSSPICDFPFVPSVMVAGKAVQLPRVDSLDYSFAGAAGAEATVNLYASYEYGVRGEKIDYVFTPQLSADKNQTTLYLTYETYCAGKEGDALVRTYEVKVIRAEQIYDLFDRRNVSVSPDENYLDFTTSTDGASMRYVHPLAANNFEVLFEIPAGKNNFTSLTFTFTDSLDPTQTMEWKIMRNDGAKRCLVYVNGEMCEMNGGFNGESKSPFHLILKSSSNQIVDHEGRVVTTLKRYADGSAYTGFGSGRFYVDISFGGVSGESIVRLERLGNQAMYAEYDAGGNLVAAGDYIEPIIVLSQDIATKAQKYSRVWIPSAQAYDAIDPYVACSVTILRDGQKIVDSVSAAEGFDFFVNEYGTYVIVYRAQDSSGNEVTRRFRLAVRDDEAPSLTVLSSVDKKVTLGKTISIPSAVALDRQGEAKVRVYIVTPTGKMICLDGQTEYKPSVKGVYTLRYYAYDEAYNSTMQDYVVTVI